MCIRGRLKILLGKLDPSEGKVKLGTKLDIAYFDQLREHLDLEKNLIDNICGGQDFIEINGKKKHAISYLRDFLFTPDRIRTPAKALSGGEQNRAILAKVFSKPSNVLVLDEPTNDLDIETLELLEDILLEFQGTVLLVSHDRQFMDNVVTSLMVFENSGEVVESVGSYSDWIRQGGSLAEKNKKGNDQAGQVKKGKQEHTESAYNKLTQQSPHHKSQLSLKKKKDLEKQLRLIEQLESTKQELDMMMAEANFYTEDKNHIDEVLKKVAENNRKLENAYRSWEELES